MALAIAARARLRGMRVAAVIGTFVGERGAVDGPRKANAENTRPADCTTAYRESDIDDRDSSQPCPASANVIESIVRLVRAAQAIETQQ